MSNSEFRAFIAPLDRHLEEFRLRQLGLAVLDLSDLEGQGKAVYLGKRGDYHNLLTAGHNRARSSDTLSLFDPVDAACLHARILKSDSDKDLALLCGCEGDSLLWSRFARRCAPIRLGRVQPGSFPVFAMDWHRGWVRGDATADSMDVIFAKFEPGLSCGASGGGFFDATGGLVGILTTGAFGDNGRAKIVSARRVDAWLGEPALHSLFASEISAGIVRPQETRQIERNDRAARNTDITNSELRGVESIPGELRGGFVTRLW